MTHVDMGQNTPFQYESCRYEFHMIPISMYFNLIWFKLMSIKENYQCGSDDLNFFDVHQNHQSMSFFYVNTGSNMNQFDMIDIDNC